MNSHAVDWLLTNNPSLKRTNNKSKKTNKNENIYPMSIVPATGFPASFDCHIM
jgi:hypothetical protein